jgi:hypothetical protein
MNSITHITHTDLISSMEEAIRFLKEYPTEIKITAARIFNVNVETLTYLVDRDPNAKHEGHNKVMNDQKEKALKNFIRSLLLHGILPTHEVVFATIKSLKKARDSTSIDSIKRWFRGWWKRSNLHKIKTKSLSIVRFEAAEESDVIRWFSDYKNVLKTLNIRFKRNILNFDEAGFRVGCLKGDDILVPADVKEHYAVSPENRKSITIIEMINAAGDFPPPPNGDYLLGTTIPHLIKG